MLNLNHRQSLKKPVSKWLQGANDNVEIYVRMVLNKLSVQTQLLIFFLMNSQKSHNFLFLEEVFFLQEVLSRRIFQALPSLLCSGVPATHHVGGKDENTFMFSTGPLRIIQKIWIVLCGFPSFTS